MLARNILIAAAVIGFAVANLVSLSLFLETLNACFPGISTRLAPRLPGESESALSSFRLALGLFLGAFPVSVLVTEAESRPARYLQSFCKSLAIALLLGGLALFYHHQRLESADRVAARVPELFPNGAPPIQLAENPLTRVLYFSGFGLLLFGPVDLLIARAQKAARARPRQPQG